MKTKPLFFILTASTLVLMMAISGIAYAQVVAEQTGLTTEEVTTPLQAGSTVAELVTTNNRDLDVVIQAASTAIDDLKSQEGMPAQMLSNLEGDSSTVATQFVQGELEGRMQQLLSVILLGGGMPARPDGAAGGGFPPGSARAVPLVKMRLQIQQGKVRDSQPLNPPPVRRHRQRL